MSAVALSNKIVKPGETTFILFHLFIFLRLLHEQQQDSCLLSLSLCNLLQFA